MLNCPHAWHAYFYGQRMGGGPDFGSRTDRLGDHRLFNEHFLGETGAGCGASDETGRNRLITLLQRPRDLFNPCLPEFAPVDYGQLLLR